MARAASLRPNWAGPSEECSGRGQSSCVLYRAPVVWVDSLGKSSSAFST